MMVVLLMNLGIEACETLLAYQTCLYLYYNCFVSINSIRRLALVLLCEKTLNLLPGKWYCIYSLNFSHHNSNKVSVEWQHRGLIP